MCEKVTHPTLDEADFLANGWNEWTQNAEAIRLDERYRRTIFKATILAFVCAPSLDMLWRNSTAKVAPGGGCCD